MIKRFLLRLLLLAALLGVGDFLLKANLADMWAGVPYLMAGGMALVVVLIFRRK